VTLLIVGLLLDISNWVEASIGAALIAAGAIAGAWFNRRYRDAPPLSPVARTCLDPHHVAEDERRSLAGMGATT
jgi:hypothetical protein